MDNSGSHAMVTQLEIGKSPYLAASSQATVVDSSIRLFRSSSVDKIEDTDDRQPLIDKQDKNSSIVSRSHTLLDRLALLLQSSISNFLVCVILSILGIVAWAATQWRTLSMDACPSSYQQEEENIHDEEITTDETYYPKRYGYDCQVHRVLTEDGYILIMYRIGKKGSYQQGKRAVLAMHGLLQCSGVFITNEKESLAFALADQGYDVWLGNNRAVATQEHQYLSPNDPQYWDWGLKEIGVYDLSAMVDHIIHQTGQTKIAYIGHSQGAAQGCIGLALRPELAEKLSCFVALAPGVFSGSLTRTFLLDRLIHLNEWTYHLIFGITEFCPVMAPVRRLLPPDLFAYLCYCAFAYVFGWWDHHWIRRRKVKYFQFTARSVSTRLVRDWLDGWGKKGVCMYVDSVTTTTHVHEVPLAVFYGTKDYLVDGARFVQMFETRSSSGNNTFLPMLQLTHVERIEGYEHMDAIWAKDNNLTTYPSLFKVLSAARWEQSH
ncbi:hypothetical protein EC973_000365 [Apophysomyces ossiformis]|uniref:Partial AB-hydrolase lipase domain-containing protein n=1 Tax=Apophysomyces ossiformis TaxID=679940 RepID=A0A8H7EPA9_9FUNG|nr:hypothetical protein EC973_000365 [Apophysomyces ossiformis]